MTFVPEWLTGSPNLDTSNWMYLYVPCFIFCPLSQVALSDCGFLDHDFTFSIYSSFPKPTSLYHISHIPTIPCFFTNILDIPADVPEPDALSLHALAGGAADPLFTTLTTPQLHHTDQYADGCTSSFSTDFG